MKLDDRPVIDQLLEPTPLNHLYEVQDEAYTWLADMHDTLPAPQLIAAEQMLKMIMNALEARL